MKNKLINILIFIISIYFPLQITEIYFLISENIENKYTSLNDKNIKNKIIRDEKILAKSNGYVPAYFPHLTKLYGKRWYPIGGQIHKKTYLCNEGYGLIKYKSDRFGLRNEDKKWDLISEKPYTIFIGDSFVHGACVKDNRTIPYLYEKKTNEISLNIGYLANDPYNYIAILRTFIRDLIRLTNQNVKIILIFHTNDICKYCKSSEKDLEGIPIKNMPLNAIDISASDGYIEKLNFSINQVNRLVPSSNLNKQKSNKSYMLSFLKNIYRTISLSKTRTKLFITYKEINYAYLYKKNGPSGKSIRIISEICQKNCKPYIAFIPSSNFWTKDNINKAYSKSLKHISNIYNVKFIELNKTINPDNIKHYAPNGGHLSELGYELVTNEIIKQTKNNFNSQLKIHNNY